MPYGIKNETPAITKKMERCVSDVMADSDFRKKYKARIKTLGKNGAKTLAIMICKKSIAGK